MSVSPSVSSLFRRLSCLCVLAAALALVQPAMAQTPPSTGSGDAPTSLTNSAPIPGCNDNVSEAGARVAEARTASTVPYIVDALPQPPSVLQSTCFNQATGVAAQQGGSIFSGDFTSGVQPIIGSALNSLYSNFENAISSLFGDEIGGAIGDILGGIFGGGSTSLQASYDCDGIDQMVQAWNSRGVNGGMSMKFENLLSGKAPDGASENFLRSWDAAKETGVFDNARTAMDALPRPQVQSFMGNKTLCEVMAALGLGGCN